MKGYNLKHLRKKKGVTLRHVANELGVSIFDASCLERNLANSPVCHTLFDYLDAIYSDMDELGKEVKKWMTN